MVFELEEIIHRQRTRPAIGRQSTGASTVWLETAYRFIDVPTLLADFLADVERAT